MFEKGSKIGLLDNIWHNLQLSVIDYQKNRMAKEGLKIHCCPQ